MMRSGWAALAAVCLVTASASGGPKTPAAATKPKDAAADINTPRADAKHVTFETTEGTWMSVDVSPDGKTIVFDLLGDLYTVPIAGGAATAITKGPAFDHHPRYSPDGTTIAFTSDEDGMENLWLVDADGRNRRALTTEKTAYVRSAAWLPGGEYLVARKEDAKRAGIPPCELWLYHRRGGNGIKLTSSDDLNNAAGPVASPDGRFIYFSAREARFSYEPKLAGGLWQIYRFDRTTAERSQISTGIGGAARPALAPDGKTLVFVSRRDAETVLVARTLATGAERILASNVQRDDQEGFAAMDVWPNYAFVPDGSAVVYSSHGKLQRAALKAGATPSDIPFRATVEQWLAPTVTYQEHAASGPVESRILRRAAQSPDGTWVGFEAFGRCWLQRLDHNLPAGSPRRLTADGGPAREYTPAFSADGQWIAYVTWTDAEGGAIWKVRVPSDPSAAPGAGERLTPSPGHYINPVWSPSGDRLAVIRGSGLEFRGQQPEDDRAFEIRWLSANGGEPEYVASVDAPGGLRFHPQVHWNRDGTRLFYGRPVERKAPTDDPKTDLVSIRLDGTDRKTLLRLPPVDDLVPSADGQWLLFSTRDEVYVTPLPPAEFEDTPEVSTTEGSVPVWRLTDAAGGYANWADGDRAITWTLGADFHRLTLASAMAFADAQRAKAAEDAIKAKAAKAAKSSKPGKGTKEAEDEKTSKDDELKVPKSESFRIALSVPRATPSGVLALTGARVVTMNGDQVLPAADVVITGNRLTAVGPAGTVSIPADAHRVDVSGTTIVPGLIDTHAHLHYSGFEVLPQTKWEYAANLAFGVTTTYDPSAPSLDVFEQGEMVEAGRMIGPRVYSSGDVLYGGQQEAIYAEVDDQEDARRQVRRMKAYGARMIKVYQQPRRDERLWLAQACREEHMLLTVEGAGELHTDLTTVIDGFTAFEHALPYELHDDVVQLLARAGTYYTPTLLVAYGGPEAEDYFYQMKNPHDDEKLRRFVPHRMLDQLGRRHPWVWPDEYHFPTVAESAARVVKAGGHVSLGAHGQLQGLGAHWELWAMAGEGNVRGQSALSPIEAWRAATRNSAEKLGLLPDLGTVETGKLADLIVLDADPLADIHNSVKIRFVVKNGELFDGPTLASRWPTEAPLPTMFWQKEP
jgi:Tol biopolymer transport system component/imidazolonepropionase-like amidohydrolase